MKKLFILLLIIVLIAAAGYFFRGYFVRYAFAPTDTETDPGVEEKNVAVEDIEIVAEGLQVPWEIVFLPNGEILVTERPGNLLKIGADRKTIKIEGVEHTSEGGLLGLALHPNFEENNWIYLYLTTRTENGLTNRVERYRLEGDKLFDKISIIENIPGARAHDGGRIEFGLDGFLYITTGDAGNSDSAQDINSLAGKILRLKDDGSIPKDNPFGNLPAHAGEIYSYGHRNSQGLAWDSEGRLWATEHGRSGALSGLDELNLIEKGKNYGWPVIQGDEEKNGMVAPVVNSGPDETWAPADAEYFDGSIFFTGLRGASLYEAKISEDGSIKSIEAHFRGEFGRLRAVKIGPDGFLYITTSNTDGRGEARVGDDKIIKINPDIFR